MCTFSSVRSRLNTTEVACTTATLNRCADVSSSWFTIFMDNTANRLTHYNPAFRMTCHSSQRYGKKEISCRWVVFTGYKRARHDSGRVTDNSDVTRLGKRCRRYKRDLSQAVLIATSSGLFSLSCLPTIRQVIPWDNLS